VSSYKAELLHRPVDPVLLRGSYQHAVRAPSVYELYAPQLGPTVFLDLDANLQTDPCSVGSEARSGADAPAVEQLCLAQGLPADLLPSFAYPDFEVPGVAGGNPDLEAETADTYTAGIVLEPALDSRWARRLQVSLDWYQIEVQDAIATVSAGEFVPRCYDRNFNAQLSLQNEYCSYFSRDATTGEIRDAQELLRNIAGYRTSGIDLQFDWSADLGPGLVGINWLVGYVATFEELRARGLSAEDDVGTIGGRVGGALPEWKWNLRASYGWSGFDVVAQWRYVDAMRDIDYPDFEVPSQDYLDLVLGYAFPNGPAAGITLRIGVENLTDADPPIFPNYVQANTDPSQYDVLGRRYFARMNYRF
jgi:outer membrane receptor protein involved in Fe transport